jgi:3D-(3,5/4)-trihydroxycyclohexane-1,2-dione acylhydrolase (decyclizing)
MSPRQTSRLTTAQAVVRYLSVQHSERDGEVARLIPAVFGIFGHGNVAGLGQALEEHGGDLPYIQSRNEQSMVHAAVGFAKASRRRRLLACSSSIGPGATNMVTGAALATINRLPVLLLPSDTYATRRQGPVLQQLEAPFAGDVSVNDCFRPVVRFFDRITRPEQLLTALPEAMRVLTDPRETGAVALSLPQDVQSEAYDYPEGFLAERTWPIRRPEPAPGDIAAVAQLLASAERPLVIAGGGVLYSDAEAALAAFAERLGVPVVETFGGKGAVQEPAWWNMGGLGLEGNPASNELAAQADLVLAVGTRLTDFATGSQSLFQDEGVRFASINVDAHDAYKQGATAIVGDARLALDRLADAAIGAGAAPSRSWRGVAERRRAAWRVTLAGELARADSPALTQGQLIATMQDAAAPGDTVIAAAGGPPGDLLKIWDASGARHCHLEFGLSCMGYELPAALGVRMAQPHGEVIALIGDGTFLMNPTELVTALQEGLKVTIVLSENHGFQVIHRLQRLRAGRSFGNEFRARDREIDRLDGPYLALDFAKIAEGLGATAMTASTAEQVRDALAAARGSDSSTVIVVETAAQADLPGGGVWWDVAPAEVSEDPVVQELRAAYVADRARLQRWYG